MKLIKKEKMNESFSAGKAGWVVEKLGGILSRKIGETVLFASIPYLYENDYGTFAGYLGSVGGGRLYLKINFSLGKSDSVSSVDVYGKKPDTPLYTLSMNALNIVEVIDVLVGELIEDGEVSEMIVESFKDRVLLGKDKLDEHRGAPTKDPKKMVYIIERWVDEDPDAYGVLSKKSLTDLYSRYFLKWANDKPNYKEIKYYLFSKIVKKYFLERGIENRTLKPRKKGRKERAIKDPILAAEFEEILEDISWEDKFEFLEGSVKQVIQGNIHSAIIIGNPGSGKTHTVEEVLETSNADYKLYKGGLKSIADVIRILYNNRGTTSKRPILVFDDLDAIFKKDQNILKAALENRPDRVITYVDVSQYKKSNKDAIPAQFDFYAGLIFIVNDGKIVDPAVASRSLTLDVELSNDQMIDKMKKSLKEYMPTVAMAVKQKALQYLLEKAPGIVAVDYRSLEKVIISMQIAPKKWEVLALTFLKSIE